MPKNNQNNILQQIIIISLILIFVHNKCYSYYAGDTYPSLNNSYCSDIIKWPVSDQVFQTYQARDQQALQNYQQLYEKYYKTDKIQLKCLGMAKYFFCAASYPTCTNTSTSIKSTCQWMCDLFSVRCGEDNQFYQDICVKKTVTDDNCSFGQNIRLLFYVLLLLLVFLIV